MITSDLSLSCSNFVGLFERNKNVVVVIVQWESQQQLSIQKLTRSPYLVYIPYIISAHLYSININSSSRSDYLFCLKK